MIGISFSESRTSVEKKHRPDWHIVLVHELTLEFGGGEALLVEVSIFIIMNQ